MEALSKRGITVPGDHVRLPGRRLLAVVAPTPGRLGETLAPLRPEVPLSSSDLLVNGRHDLRLGTEVVRELASANSVDLLCSFLKWSGFRVIEDGLREFLARHPRGVRVLTTAYMGATERRALDALVELGANVRVWNVPSRVFSTSMIQFAWRAFARCWLATDLPRQPRWTLSPACSLPHSAG